MTSSGRLASARRHRAILVPGAVLPAALAYAALLEALAGRVEAVTKDLEVYAGERPPAGYTLDMEVEGVLRTAEAVGFDSFHLVGYSAGGAASLMFAARHPDRLLSLSLLEASWAGRQGLTPAEEAAWEEYARIRRLPADELMPAFVRANLKPGVEPPPPPSGEAPPWMAKRPAGIDAILEAMGAGELDLGALRRFRRPVFYALGGLSNPDQYLEIARRLAGVFDDFTLEVFEERHHFDPPHRAEPARLAASLEALWTCAEAAQP